MLREDEDAGVCHEALAASEVEGEQPRAALRDGDERSFGEPRAATDVHAPEPRAALAERTQPRVGDCVAVGEVDGLQVVAVAGEHSDTDVRRSAVMILSRLAAPPHSTAFASIAGATNMLILGLKTKDPELTVSQKPRALSNWAISYRPLSCTIAYLLLTGLHFAL